jgi:hypothetical protein
MIERNGCGAVAELQSEAEKSDNERFLVNATEADCGMVNSAC